MGVSVWQVCIAGIGQYFERFRTTSRKGATLSDQLATVGFPKVELVDLVSDLSRQIEKAQVRRLDVRRQLAW